MGEFNSFATKSSTLLPEKVVKKARFSVINPLLRGEISRSDAVLLLQKLGIADDSMIEKPPEPKETAFRPMKKRPYSLKTGSISPSKGRR